MTDLGTVYEGYKGVENMKKTQFDEVRKIWEFYEELNEIVYVADMDSHELVYMNRLARELYFRQFKSLCSVQL